MPFLASLLAGLVFGLGLILSGMADPAKVLGFLDLAGAWDPSLAFVMLGAIAVGLVAFAVAGFCPGPALVALGMGQSKAVVFVAAMLLGMGAFELLERRSATVPQEA
jgi:uncharacterized membrane protein YedE/YeeE